jgi:hypothetical protein
MRVGAETSLAALNERTMSNALRFVQCVALGATAAVEAHVIVPTSLGMLLDEERDLLVTAFRSSSIKVTQAFELLKKYDEVIFKRCAYCFEHLRPDCKKLRQIVMHIVGGQVQEDAEEWAYEIVFGLLCWKCQTVPRSSLMRVDEFCYNTLCTALSQHAFTKSVSLESLLLINDNDGRAALADAYLWRIAQANTHTKDIVRTLHEADADDCVMCYHCQRTRKKKECLSCPGCDAVMFCMIPSMDKRIGGGRVTCFALAVYYHFELCAMIKTNRLFHIDRSKIVAVEGE